jgi:TRAP-type C4-dicarboxylate transport system permease small subunit
MYLPKAVAWVDMTLADKVNYVFAVIIMAVVIAFTGLIIWFAVYQFREPIKEAKLAL